MARAKASSTASSAPSTATIGFEAKLWLTADKLRNNMDAAEYKHVVLGLIFLKYISDTFEEHRAKLVAGSTAKSGAYAGSNPEDQDEYKAENVFWVPPAARWPYLQASAKQPTIGKIVDDAMVAIERDNPRLKGVLPKDYARPGLDKQRLGDLPFEMIREAVVNALIHRDYDLVGQKCQLVVSPDKITIKSPGGPIPPITLEQMKAFNAPIKSRNPLLHYVFARMGLAEEQGFGLASLKQQAEKLGLPLPSYSMEGDSLVLTIYRSKADAVAGLPLEVRETLNADERKGWEFLTTKPSVTRKEYAEQLGFDDRKAQRHLKRFVELRLLQKVGASSSTEYEVRKP